jgi:cytochrome c peroxidase
VNRLDRVVKIMAEVQMGKMLSEENISSIVSFLVSLTGNLPEEALTLPVLPPSQ